MHNTERHIPKTERSDSQVGFSEKILELWKKMYPETFSLNISEREQAKDQVERREEVVDQQEILQLLKEYGVDTQNISIEVLENDRFRIKVSDHFSQKRLPPGYAYKGGAARALLMKNLNIDKFAIPRDVDIVRTVEKEPQIGMDKTVGMEFMPEDFQFDYGIETVLDNDDYFATRDFSINEVLATDESIVATKQCVLDVARKIVRLSEFEREERQNGVVGPKMLAKVLRLYSENIHRYGESQIANVSDWEFEKYFISPFWLALQLDKACEVNIESAKIYVQQLIERKQIPSEITTVEDAAKYLVGLLCGDPFYYRHAPSEQFEVENKLAEEYEDKFDSIKKPKKIRKK